MAAKKSSEEKQCYLLQSTTYPLNNSCSKYATVGLEFYGGQYRPAVQISKSEHMYSGIVLNSVGWRMIRDNMHKVMGYTYGHFDEAPEIYAPDRIEIEGYSIDFTVMHNIKSVQFTRKVFDPLPAKYKRMLAAKEAEAAAAAEQAPPLPESTEQRKETEGVSEKITELSSPSSAERRDTSAEILSPDTTTRGSDSGASHVQISE
ncbi:uncharacterized protein LOC111693304 [Trichogramma pretiosum]|uniref:uncharacterized protein LOC111693304 n=1 Tax=Trichogramma pretiosum TaxID=7493 RepID=UPI000C718C01|nr:uncharacterized protein LOC111693304 [Trichogramma pretiosum]